MYRCANSLRSFLVNPSHHSKCYATLPSSREQPFTSSKPVTRLAGRTKTHDVYNRLTKFTNKIIDGAARERKGWHPTPSTRGVEKRLTQSIKTAERSVRAQSLEKARYDADEEPFEVQDSFSSEILEPGTFIETRRNEISSHGIVIREEYVEQRLRIISLMSNGELWSPLKDDIMFAVPNFAPTDLAARCGTWEIAKKETELHARVEMLKRLREIERAVEDAYTSLCKSTIDIYSLVKSPNPEEWSTTTVAEVARIFPQKSTLIGTFAAHKYLMDRPLMYVAHHDYRSTHSFDVRPQSHVDEIETIMAWSRLSNGPLDAFASRARPVMALNQKIHAESFRDPPTKKQAEHNWTKDDAVILSFLLNSLRPYRTNQADPYSLGQSALLRKIDPHRPRVDDHTVHKTLVDLGAMAPWQDPLMLAVDPKLDRDNDKTSPEAMKQNALVQRAISSPPISSGPLGPEDLYPSDPLDSVRHDFGDMPVYVIDDASAEELDDGVSIETVSSEPGNFWVHTHVADPASTLPPGHVFSQRAAQLGESTYFIHRSRLLLPLSLTHSGLPGFSIGSASVVGKPERVLTFSSKVNPHGELIDYNVRAGIIHNIHRLSYDSVDLAMGRSLVYRSYPFGGQPPAPLTASLNQRQLHDLSNLEVVANRFVTRRLKDRSFTASENKADIHHARSNSNITSPTIEPVHFHGFPNLRYAVTSSSDLDRGSRNIVAEMMKLACRAASRFCLDRGIPVLRRSGAPPVARSDSDFEKLLSMRSSNGYVHYYDALPFLVLNPIGDYTLGPKQHFTLGVPEGEGYVRTTSPLRRYGDLVSHWQIHHALLGTAAPRAPPFSAEWLENFGRQTKSKDRLRRRNQGHHDRFWQLMYLKRRMKDTARGVDLSDPLDQLEAITLASSIMNLETRWYQTQVHIPSLGMEAVLVGLDKVEIPLSTRVLVKIEDIRLGVRPQLIVHLR